VEVKVFPKETSQQLQFPGNQLKEKQKFKKERQI
jgi:hypothetical protein